MQTLDEFDSVVISFVRKSYARIFTKHVKTNGQWIYEKRNYYVNFHNSTQQTNNLRHTKPSKDSVQNYLHFQKINIFHNLVHFYLR